MACRSSPDQARSESCVKSWVRGSLLGAGAFGKVNLALNRENAELFAVKSAECSLTAEAGYLAIRNEQEILQSLDSPFVVGFLGSDRSVENGKSMHNIFLEYMPGGSLADLMKKFGGSLDEQLIRAYTKGILQGIQYIHSQGVVHCDIKGKNVLVGSTGIKLADFGAAKRVREDDSSSECPTVITGTPLWMAPEVVRQEEQGTASDIWSLGCTIVEMATGKAPWNALHSLNNPFVALYHIGCSNEVPDLPAALSEEGKDFLQKCFRRDPRERWTSAQLLQHSFVTKALPIETPQALPLSPKSVLDQNWDSQNSSIGKSVPIISLEKRPSFGTPLRGNGEADWRMAAVPRFEDPEAEGGSWWSSSPFSPPAGKWIVVHSPKSSLPSSDPVHVFSDFFTQRELHLSKSFGSSSKQSVSANGQSSVSSIDISQQQDDTDPASVTESDLYLSISLMIVDRIEIPNMEESSTLKEQYSLLVIIHDAVSLHNVMSSQTCERGNESTNTADQNPCCRPFGKSIWHCLCSFKMKPVYGSLGFILPLMVLTAERSSLFVSYVAIASRSWTKNCSLFGLEENKMSYIWNICADDALLFSFSVYFYMFLGCVFELYTCFSAPKQVH